MSDNKCAACGQFAGRGHKCPTPVVPTTPVGPTSVRYLAGEPGTPHVRMEVKNRTDRAGNYIAARDQDFDPPTEVRPDGTMVWLNASGKLHRDGDQPAIVYGTGGKEWRKNGIRHRDGDQPAIIRSDGTQAWYQNGQVHRDGDQPAIIYPDGEKVWYRKGSLHRDNGPAVTYPDGGEEWYRNGDLHREDGGPAVIRADGTMEWCQNGVLHRTDGPAVMKADGTNAWNATQEWWVNGRQVAPLTGQPL